MPLEKIKLEGTAGQGTLAVNRRGFPACVVKGRKKMAKKLSATYGKFRYVTSVARLDAMGAPHVKIGSVHTYCPSSYFWWLENFYQPKPNEKNLKQPQIKYDVISVII